LSYGTTTGPVGTIILHLDNETFQKAFRQGRSMYFDDCEYDFPHVASRMNILDASGSVLDEDGKGGYCFDRMAFKDPFDILGFFLGYMSGPILTESREERKARRNQMMIAEQTGPTKVAL
jgi:hypothetical protein